MEEIEEGAKLADAEDDLVSSWRPLRGQDVAVFLLMDHLRAPGYGVRHEQTSAQRIRRRAAVGDELVAGRTEGGKVRAGQAQFVIRTAAECFLERGQLHGEAFVKHNLLAVGRPRGSAYVPARPAFAAGVVNPSARRGLILSNVANVVSGERARIYLHPRTRGEIGGSAGGRVD